jgi:beta-lactam-binding protein with PASTA domain
VNGEALVAGSSHQRGSSVRFVASFGSTDSDVEDGNGDNIENDLAQRSSADGASVHQRKRI